MAAFRFFQWTLLNGNGVSENVLSWQGAVELFCTMVFCQDTLVKVKAKAVELRFQLAKLAKLQLPRAWPICFSRCQRFWLGRCSKETTRDENGVCCKSSRGEPTENLLHETGAKSTCFCVCQHHVHVVDEVASLSGLVMFPKPPCRWRLYTSFSRVPGGAGRDSHCNFQGCTWRDGGLFWGLSPTPVDSLLEMLGILDTLPYDPYNSLFSWGPQKTPCT